MASASSTSFPPGEGAPAATEEAGDSVAPISRRSAAELLIGLGRLADRLSSFELVDEAAATAVLQAAAATLSSELSLALQLLHALERLNETDGAADLLRFDEGATPTPPRSTPPTPTTPTIADVCFAGALELSRVRQELTRRQDSEAACVATETALRKLRRVIMAVLQTAEAEGTTSVGSAEHLRRHQAADTRAALQVRRLYAEFRHGLRRSEAEDPESVLKALRYSAGALAVLVTSPAYAQARVSDRALLRRLRERMLAWSRNGRDVARGLQLLDDIWTCADLLRDVNRRQELRAHDGESIGALLDEPDRAGARFSDGLASLLGLDDDLDELIGAWRESHAPATEARLIAQLEQLRATR